jgi:hypothetical protein
MLLGAVGEAKSLVVTLEGGRSPVPCHGEQGFLAGSD